MIRYCVWMPVHSNQYFGTSYVILPVYFNVTHVFALCPLPFALLLYNDLNHSWVQTINPYILFYIFLFTYKNVGGKYYGLEANAMTAWIGLLLEAFYWKGMSTIHLHTQILCIPLFVIDHYMKCICIITRSTSCSKAPHNPTSCAVVDIDVDNMNKWHGRW